MRLRVVDDGSGLGGRHLGILVFGVWVMACGFLVSGVWNFGFWVMGALLLVWH